MWFGCGLDEVLDVVWMWFGCGLDEVWMRLPLKIPGSCVKPCKCNGGIAVKIEDCDEQGAESCASCTRPNTSLKSNKVRRKECVCDDGFELTNDSCVKKKLDINDYVFDSQDFILANHRQVIPGYTELPSKVRSQIKNRDFKFK